MKFPLVWIIFLFATFFSHAEPTFSFMNIPIEEFPLEKTIRWDDDSVPELTLLPEVPGAEIIRDRFLDYEPDVTVQRLYRLPLAERVDTRTPMGRRELFSAIVNALGSPGRQVEYEYHSATRDEYINLFEESYISDEDGEEVAGFQYEPGDLPSKIEYYQYVDEANFSGTVLRQMIRVGDDYLTFHSSNTERMWVKIIPVLKPDGSRNEVLMFTHDEVLYVYNTTQIAKEPLAKKIGLPIHLPSMFRKRMDVMAEWLTEEISDFLAP